MLDYHHLSKGVLLNGVFLKGSGLHNRVKTGSDISPRFFKISSKNRFGGLLFFGFRGCHGNDLRTLRTRHMTDVVEQGEKKELCASIQNCYCLLSVLPRNC